MKAMVLHAAGHRLLYEERMTPEPGDGQVRVRVEACGVCRTDLHIVDEYPRKYPGACRFLSTPAGTAGL
jgi:propanol-preferring alcohol dehydrogenase